MFVPKILKICPTDGSDQLYIEWTTPEPSVKPVVVGYILAYRRSDLDLNYSSRTLIGRHVCSTVIPCSRVSQRYDVKISAFNFRQFGDFSIPVTWSAIDLLPRPRISKISSTENGHGIQIQWKVILEYILFFTDEDLLSETRG
ncbi:hypothetical protein FSP39_021592 [Pinctada imbricata]|uniref:Fibronectin type-III domain-containing protein n=1 Tax=Pinctada imbricata TaxID=66713 RepID=A0AA88YWJ9_PINIB|nr:hypothetical protein FSP39_021592 [Pinctada imbricata]